VTFSTALPPLVADASVAVDAVLAEPDAVAAWTRWVETDRILLAPPIAWPEIAQALLRRGMPPADVAVRLEGLELAGLETADRGRRGVAEAVVLAARHHLSVYDATYLWLAIDVDGELATRDRALARAASDEGVPLALEA
jgi:predicted nucleic acid-binding protein